MSITAEPTDLEAILPWRKRYRAEMGCQIVHDSIHIRPGWTRELRLCDGGATVGYGSVAVAGPWAGRPTAYEFYVVPHHRTHAFELFRAFLDAGGAAAIEVQSNDRLATTMLYAFSRDVTSRSILFEDQATTAHAPPGAALREARAGEVPDISEEQMPWHRVVEVEGAVAATGGILFHYNPPYGDIHMAVAEPFRGRGLGSFLVQELKRICYENGYVPSARCSPENVASRRTLQKAGFAPCGHILTGSVVPPLACGSAPIEDQLRASVADRGG